MINIGIIGDYNKNRVSHPETNTAIEHTANHLSININYKWIPTTSLSTTAGIETLESYDGLWISSGGPYKSMEGALNGTRYAREKDCPIFGT